MKESIVNDKDNNSQNSINNKFCLYPISLRSTVVIPNCGSTCTPPPDRLKSNSKKKIFLNVKKI